MRVFLRAFGDCAVYALLALLALVMTVAGCDSDSDGGSSLHHAYVSNYSGESVSVINTQTNNVAKTIRLPHRGGYTAVLRSLNRLYVTGLETDEVTQISTSSNRVVKTVHLPWRAGAVAVDTVTKKVFVAEHGSMNTIPALVPLGTRICVLRGSDLAVLSEITVPAAVNLQSLAVDSTNRRLYVADAGDGVNPGAVFPINIDTETILSPVTCGVSPSGVAVLPSEHLVYVTNLGDDTVTAVDFTDEDLPATSTISVGASPYSVSVDPTLERAVVTNAPDNTISIISTSMNTVIAPSPVIMGTYPVWSAVNSTLGRAYVVNSGSDDVSVVNLETGGVVATVPVGEVPISVSVID
jgi:YVTN family beta-propeller protein